MSTLGESIRAHVDTMIGRRQRGESASATPPSTSASIAAVQYRDLPLSAAVIRAFAIECTTCYSLTMRSSADDHAAWHVTEALRAAGMYADPPPFIAHETPPTTS